MFQEIVIWYRVVGVKMVKDGRRNYDYVGEGS